MPSSSTPQKWDAIVIGSGIGGLTAATILAKVSNRRVLVLEKHSERGGLTHVFRRDGAPWDVGVHYVGGMEPGSQPRTLFDFLSSGALEWNKMPYDFERFVYPGVEPFAVPADPGVYQQRLVERFPDEAAAIRRYFFDLKAAGDWFGLGMMQTAVPRLVASAIGRWRKRRAASKFTQTTREYLDANFKSEELKALLVSQWPDYGLPPEESAFALHAVVVFSFANGAWFPRGGSGRIARTFEVGIEAHGGAVKVCHEVTGIIIGEDGWVKGVKAVDRSGGPESGTEVEYHSPIVISNVGAHLTYKKLLPTDGAIGRKTAAVREVVDRLDGGPSAVTLYLRLEKPVSTIGLKGENYWIHTALEHADLESQTAAVLVGKPQHVYMSFPSTKSEPDGHDARFHTAEVIAIVNGSAFAEWAGTAHGMRGAKYLDLKDRIARGLLDLAETATPGLKALVRYSELSTPLSVEHYTSRPVGSIYGLKGTSDRYNSPVISSASPIPGLYISGCDAAGLGVIGALMGGVMAASRVLGPFGFLKVMRAARAAVSSPPSPQLDVSLPSPATGKRRAIVGGKRSLAPHIWELALELDRGADFAPGQFAILRVAPFEWRSYSIASLQDDRLTLLISSRTGGDGSVFVEAADSGDETQVELPFGQFQLRKGSTNRKVFVATGTGIAPFLPMFRALEVAGELDKAELLFGCRLAEENITARLTTPLPPTTVCVSGDPSAEGVFHGRVTKRLESLASEAERIDFYFCGSPAMVSDCRDMMVRAGATQIMTELY